MRARPFLAPGEMPPAKPPKFPSKPAPGRPPRRRGLLGAVAALAVVPTIVQAAAPANPDAELLDLCRQHVLLAAEEKRTLIAMRAFDVTDESPAAQAAEDAWDVAGDAAMEVLERVVKLPALTLEGAAAKGRAVLAYIITLDCPGDEDGPPNYTDMAARAVLRDLHRLAGGAA